MTSTRETEGEGEAVCERPPEGWRCTREPGHDGPCAAVPTKPEYVAHWTREPTHEDVEALDSLVRAACDLMSRRERILRACDELDEADVPVAAVEPIRDFAASLIESRETEG